MKAVLLDADTLGENIDLSPIQNAVSELVVYGQTNASEVVQRTADADLVLTNKVRIDEQIIQNKKAILVMATGTNNVDRAAAERLSVPVLNVTNYGTQSVAQHTFMLILALAGRLPQYQQTVAEGAWQQHSFFCLMNFTTTQLAGKTLVIVGAGALGSAVAKLAEAIGMQVIFSARPGASDDVRPGFESLLPQADVLSFHCPLGEHTRHLLNATRLAHIKRGCLVVNCARGGIVDEIACLQALQNGILGGLAVDVLPVEPPRDGHPLLDALNNHLNLIVTPHNAWISREARQNIIELTAANIRSLV